tara:strand:- start:414 stop:818 length:405 start_codon:yes stop_codon:yes gene_type:complete
MSKSTKKSPKKKFFYNPNDPKTSFDVYINKRPEDTIPIKYSTVEDVKKTIRKLESHFKKKEYSHKRIWQVAMIMRVRLKVIHQYKNTRYPNAKHTYARYSLADKYYTFLKKRTLEKGKNAEETFKLRKSMTFNI